MQATVKVLGGLEITVEFSMQGAEPDVGIMSAYVEEWSISEIAGRLARLRLVRLRRNYRPRFGLNLD